jgi:Flp pilus assembly secretin CpaC
MPAQSMKSSTNSRLPSLQMINLMNIPGEQQILLKVRVADVTRSSLREAGFGFDFVANKWDLNVGTLAGGANIAAILSSGRAASCSCPPSLRTAMARFWPSQQSSR